MFVVEGNTGDPPADTAQRPPYRIPPICPLSEGRHRDAT
jgi:hypothetical protein